MSQRCKHCPVRGEIPCPAVDGVYRSPVPRYCENMERDPETWAPEVVKTAESDHARGQVLARPVATGGPCRPVDAAPRPRPGPLPSRGPVRAVLLAPAAVGGGAENWMRSLLLNVPRDRVEWLGVGIVSDALVSDAMIASLGQLAPVAIGAEGVRALAREAEAAVLWGIGRPEELIHRGPGGPATIGVSHSEGHSLWAIEINAQASPSIDAWAGVSTSSLETVPADRRSSAVIIPNALDPDRLRPGRDRDQVRAEWGLPPGAKVLGFLGRASSEKDPWALNRALTALPEPWWGVGVGAGVYLDELRATAPERVRWVGEDLRAGDVLNAFDVCLIPSLYESFGYTILEAWASSVPSVTTRQGIAAEHPGLSVGVPAGASAERIATAVLSAASDPGRAEAARRLAWDRYRPEPFGAAWASLIESVALPRRPLPVPDPLDREAQLAADRELVRSLTDEQRERSIRCKQRVQRQRCCGPDDWCLRDERWVDTARCARCVIGIA